MLNALETNRRDSQVSWGRGEGGLTISLVINYDWDPSFSSWSHYFARRIWFNSSKRKKPIARAFKQNIDAPRLDSIWWGLNLRNPTIKKTIFSTILAKMVNFWNPAFLNSLYYSFKTCFDSSKSKLEIYIKMSWVNEGGGSKVCNSGIFGHLTTFIII